MYIIVVRVRQWSLHVAAIVCGSFECASVITQFVHLEHLCEVLV